MKAINAREALTDREREEFEQQMTYARQQADYQLKFKELELQIQFVQTRWTQVFRLPFAILMLPVRLVMALSYVVHAVRKNEPGDKFWEYLTKL